MATTASYFVNSPVSGTHYVAPGGFWFKPNGANWTVQVEAWSGANGTGSRVSVTSLTAVNHDISTNSDLNSFTGSSANTADATSSQGSGDWCTMTGFYTGAGVGSLKMFATYSGTAYIPSVSSFTPAAGGVGTVVDIFGSNFHDNTGVLFNGTPAAATSFLSDSHITGTVPSGAATGLISVTNQNGTGNSATNFIVSSMHVWDSAAWQPATVYVWDGAAWQVALGVYVWDGTTWQPAS